MRPSSAPAAITVGDRRALTDDREALTDDPNSAGPPTPAPRPAEPPSGRRCGRSGPLPRRALPPARGEPPGPGLRRGARGSVGRSPAAAASPGSARPPTPPAGWPPRRAANGAAEPDRPRRHSPGHLPGHLPRRPPPGHRRRGRPDPSRFETPGSGESARTSKAPHAAVRPAGLPARRPARQDSSRTRPADPRSEGKQSRNGTDRGRERRNGGAPALRRTGAAVPSGGGAPGPDARPECSCAPGNHASASAADDWAERFSSRTSRLQIVEKTGTRKTNRRSDSASAQPDRLVPPLVSCQASATRRRTPENPSLPFLDFRPAESGGVFRIAGGAESDSPGEREKAPTGAPGPPESMNGR